MPSPGMPENLEEYMRRSGEFLEAYANTHGVDAAKAQVPELAKGIGNYPQGEVQSLIDKADAHKKVEYKETGSQGRYSRAAMRRAKNMPKIAENYSTEQYKENVSSSYRSQRGQGVSDSFWQEKAASAEKAGGTTAGGATASKAAKVGKAAKAAKKVTWAKWWEMLKKNPLKAMRSGKGLGSTIGWGLAVLAVGAWAWRSMAGEEDKQYNIPSMEGLTLGAMGGDPRSAQLLEALTKMDQGMLQQDIGLSAAEGEIAGMREANSTNRWADMMMPNQELGRAELPIGGQQIQEAMASLAGGQMGMQIDPMMLQQALAGGQ